MRLVRSRAKLMASATVWRIHAIERATDGKRIAETSPYQQIDGPRPTKTVEEVYAKNGRYFGRMPRKVFRQYRP